MQDLHIKVAYMEHSPNKCKTCESKYIFRKQIKENLLSDLISKNAKFLQGNAIIIKIWAGQFRISSMMQHELPWELSKSVLLRAFLLST